MRVHNGMGISEIFTEFKCKFVQGIHAPFPNTQLLFPVIEQPEQDVRPHDFGVWQQVANTFEALLYSIGDVF